MTVRVECYIYPGERVRCAESWFAAAATRNTLATAITDAPAVTPWPRISTTAPCSSWLLGQ